MVEGTGLENQRGATHHGFESHSLRHTRKGTVRKMHKIRNIAFGVALTGVLVAGGMAIARLFEQWLSAMSWGL